MTWILIIISIFIGGFITYLCLKPSLEKIESINENIIQQNNEISQKNEKILQENSNLLNENNLLINQKNTIQSQINNLNETLSIAEKQAKTAADMFYKSKMQVAQENLERSLELEGKKFQENVESFKSQYNETVSSLMEEYNELSEKVSQMRATTEAAVAAAKRADEIKSQENYYRIQLSEENLHEIELLREVEPYLKDKEPLNKVIWKCYYEKPTTDMIGRVIGSGIYSGIYKITEINSGRCYVGQSVNISERFKQHIKRGLGAETPTNNKLYPAMKSIGVENFTFELIEKCDKTLLDDREKFWTDYFKAQEFGYSVRKG